MKNLGLQLSPQNKESKMTKTTLKIDGMMCSMCEAHVNDVIRRLIPSAKKVKSSHRKGETTFLTDEKAGIHVDEKMLADEISKTGYRVLSIESTTK